MFKAIAIVWVLVVGGVFAHPAPIGALVFGVLPPIVVWVIVRIARGPAVPRQELLPPL